MEKEPAIELIDINEIPLNEKPDRKVKPEGRTKVYDVARGILILLVVIGHSTDVSEIWQVMIYWFHMPAFFILSGIFFKDRRENPFLLFLKLVRKYWIPLWIYYFLTLLTVKIGTGDFVFSQKDFWDNVRGGRAATGSVYWFPTVLILTVFLYTLLERYFKPGFVFPAILLLYAAAHYESVFLVPDSYEKPVIWGADIVLISVFYFFIGVRLRKTIRKWTDRINPVLYSVVFLTSALLLFLQLRLGDKRFIYVLNMKTGKYTDMILDFVIPALFTAAVFALSKLLQKFKPAECIFSFIGRHTIGIMYLHVSLLAMFSAADLKPQINIPVTVTISILAELVVNKAGAMLSDLFSFLRRYFKV